MADDSTTPDLFAGHSAAISAIIGRRAEQQDAGKLLSARLADGRAALLIIIADGMGGHAGGAEASTLAVRAFADAFGRNTRLPWASRLRDGLEAANAAIAAGVAANSQLAGMGCTLVAAVLDGRRLTWISVGDTLLLASSRRGLRRLNADHSIGGVLDARAERGEITAEAARTSPDRHLLRAALTGDRIALIDEGEEQLSAGELVLAATDGILTLPRERMEAIAARARTPNSAVTDLLEAISAGMPPDQDNTTIAAARVGARSGGAQAPARRVNPRVLVAVLAFLVVLAAIAVLAVVALSERQTAEPPSHQGVATGPARPAGGASAREPDAPAAAGGARDGGVRTTGFGQAYRTDDRPRPAAPGPQPPAKANPPARRPPATAAPRAPTAPTHALAPTTPVASPALTIDGIIERANRTPPDLPASSPKPH